MKRQRYLTRDAELRMCTLSGAPLQEIMGTNQSARHCCQVSSPPVGEGIPAFSWSAFPDVAHEGQPDTWNFPWQTFSRGQSIAFV